MAGPRAQIYSGGTGSLAAAIPAHCAPWQLTRVCLKNAASVAEVLRVLDDWDLCHSDDDGVGAHLRGRRGVVAVGDVVERTGRVIIVTDDG